MVRRNGAEARKERLQLIARLIQSQLHKEGEISLPKTIAELQYESGLTEEKILEYLRILEDLGQFVVDEELGKIAKKSGQSG